MRIHIDLAEKDKTGKNIGLQKLFRACKDSPRKFYTHKMDGEGAIHFRTYSPSKQVTIQGDGDFDMGDPILIEQEEDEMGYPSKEVSVFEHNGFVEVEKIVED